MFGKLPLRNHDQVPAGAEAEEAALQGGPVEGEDQLPRHGAADPDPRAGGEGDSQRWAARELSDEPSARAARPGPSRRLIPILSLGLGLPTPSLGHVPLAGPRPTPWPSWSPLS